MSDLKKCLEAAGFTNVKTLLSSGNAVFDSPNRSAPAIEQKIETALTKQFDRSFHTIVRSRDELQKIMAADPFAAFDLPSGAKRVIAFAECSEKRPSVFPLIGTVPRSSPSVIVKHSAPTCEALAVPSSRS